MLLSIAEPVEVYVAFSEGPEFWLHRKSDKVEIKQMQADLTELYSSPNSASVTPFFRPTVGSQLYAARCTDGSWYRAQLMLIKDSGVAEAHFVDYGDSHEVSLVNMRPLPSKWQSIPPFTIRCRLQVPNKPNHWPLSNFSRETANPI